MKIVIDIDENLYTRLFENGVDNYDVAVDMAKSIRKGIPLPKRMLSVDLIVETLCPKDEDYDYPCIAPSYLEEELERLLLDDAPTIIEADKGESEDK